jgi:hypothetical protein
MLTFCLVVIYILLTLLFKISGLARRVRDSGLLKSAFEQQVLAEESLCGQATTLVRCVATQWNSELAAVRSHIALKNPVQRLTGQTSNKVAAYRLTNSQWDLSRHLAGLLLVRNSNCLTCMCSHKLIVLQAFESLTLKFSQGLTPLMADVLEDLHWLQIRLVRVQDSVQMCSQDGAVVDNPPIIRVAAHAAILVYEKYLPKLHECEAYAIAIGKPLLNRPVDDLLTGVLCSHVARQKARLVPQARLHT